MDAAEKERTVTAVVREFRSHRFDTFVENPPSIAQDGRSVVVPGCVQCKTRIHTTGQFVEHLLEHVKKVIERAL